MIIGGPGAGKTRGASFYPKPIYADCEDGRASIADRKVAYTVIKNSENMLDFLSFLKDGERTPKQQRKYQTVVIDTLDAFQRIVKDEWVLDNRAEKFSGYDAWGYLDAKMNMLLTRVLNLDYNVIINVHFKSKTIKDEQGEESSHTVLQLEGGTKDTIFNDFDLVGWMDTYWAQENGEKVEKRGLTYQRTAKRPFLKDRFGVTPKWLPVEFSPEDYNRLWNCFTDHTKELPDTEVVEEIGESAEVKGKAVDPETASGPLPPQEPIEAQLKDLSKPDLLAMAKEMGIPVKTNDLKGELIKKIEAKRNEPRGEAATGSGATQEPAADAGAEASAKPSEDDDTPMALAGKKTTPSEDSVEVEPEADKIIREAEEEGKPLQPMPVEQVAHETNAEIIADDKPPAKEAKAAPVTEQIATDTPEPAAPKEPAASKAVCADCSKSVDPKADKVRLSEIRFRRQLCEDCFDEAKKAIKK